MTTKRYSMQLEPQKSYTAFIYSVNYFCLIRLFKRLCRYRLGAEKRAHWGKSNAVYFGNVERFGSVALSAGDAAFRASRRLENCRQKILQR